MTKPSKLMVYNKNIFSLLSLKYRVSSVDRNTDDERYLVFFFNRNEDIEKDFAYLQKAFAERDMTKQLMMVVKYVLEVYQCKHERVSVDGLDLDIIDDIGAYLKVMNEKYK